MSLKPCLIFAFELTENSLVNLLQIDMKGNNEDSNANDVSGDGNGEEDDDDQKKRKKKKQNKTENQQNGEGVQRFAK